MVVPRDREDLVFPDFMSQFVIKCILSGFAYTFDIILNLWAAHFSRD